MRKTVNSEFGIRLFDPQTHNIKQSKKTFNNNKTDVFIHNCNHRTRHLQHVWVCVWACVWLCVWSCVWVFVCEHVCVCELVCECVYMCVVCVYLGVLMHEPTYMHVQRRMLSILLYYCPPHFLQKLSPSESVAKLMASKCQKSSLHHPQQGWAVFIVCLRQSHYIDLTGLKFHYVDQATSISPRCMCLCLQECWI